VPDGFGGGGVPGWFGGGTCGAGFGGAIFNHAGTVSLRNATLSGNSAIGGSSANGGTPGSGLGGAGSAALAGMKRRRSGRIINIASTHGLVASPNKSAYIAAKHGIVGFTKATAVEVAEEGIRCNAICPGFVHTSLVQKQIEDRAREAGVSLDKATRDIVLAPVPTKEFVTVEQIAAAALFLAADGGAQMNGSNFVIDGGWTAR